MKFSALTENKPENNLQNSGYKSRRPCENSLSSYLIITIKKYYTKDSS
jgi:hypothetical protein